MRCPSAGRVVVIKMGGSVFSDTAAYEVAARFLVCRLQRCAGERFVVVVSAQGGLTDALERTALRVTSAPGKRSLDLLWSTGEVRSVALLSLNLEALGVGVVGLNIHEAGMRVVGACVVPGNLDLLQTGIQRALAEYSVVVVPGFFATDKDGIIVSLGRGSSDLTAVLVAEALDAAQCELIKDVPGYFTKDPHEDRHALHVPSLSYRQALAMADAGCGLVQKEALEAAAEAQLPLLIRSMADDGRRSVVFVDGGNRLHDASGSVRAELDTPRQVLTDEVGS
jgi:aspartate kinase